MGDTRKSRHRVSAATLKDSFHYAWLGLCVCWLTQRNFRLHICAAWLVLGLAVFSPLSTIQVLLVLLAVAGVVVAELVNTAIEWLLDYLVPEYSPLVGHIKNVTAAAVLVTALAAVMVGIVIFGPIAPQLLPRLGEVLAAHPLVFAGYILFALILGMLTFGIPVRNL